MTRLRSPAELRRAYAEYLTNRSLRFADLAAQFGRHPGWLRRQWLDLQLPPPVGRDCGEQHCLPSRADVLDAWNRYPAESAARLAELLGMRADSLRRLWRDEGMIARERRADHRAGTLRPVDSDEALERQWRAAHPGKGSARRVLSDEVVIALHGRYSADRRLTIKALADSVGVDKSSLSSRWERMGLQNDRWPRKSRK